MAWGAALALIPSPGNGPLNKKASSRSLSQTGLSTDFIIQTKTTVAHAHSFLIHSALSDSTLVKMQIKAILLTAFAAAVAMAQETSVTTAPSATISKPAYANGTSSDYCYTSLTESSSTKTKSSSTTLTTTTSSGSGSGSTTSSAPSSTTSAVSAAGANGVTSRSQFAMAVLGLAVAAGLVV
ncbi:hypothetical protein B0H67DRAFT_649757 [Lasiosphaeris hirsuta]|uniref:Uncharacterized protein n=1 Tax=Lasiosphaeris hirsuta TaxID=260670 RepID=A0AA39ZXG4_9PEZI|nr:hypothetical protein B0H67DRAFT_649757 [Lasiosphaeris hirsuta]